MFHKSAKMTQMGNTVVSKGGILTQAICVYFCDSKYANVLPMFTDTASCPMVLLQNVKDLPDIAGQVRVNPETGVKEVYAKVRFDTKNKDNDPSDYIRRNIDAFKQGEYNGTFHDMARYWDDKTKSVAKYVWLPLEDVHGNTPLLKLSIWRGDVPRDRLKQGVEIDIPGCTFEIFLRLEKVKGAAKLKEDNLKNQAAAANVPSGPSDGTLADAAAAAAAAQSKREPQAFLGISTNAGVQIRSSYVEGTTALQAFAALINNRRHFLRLPAHNDDSYAFVQRLEVCSWKELADSLRQFKHSAQQCAMRYFAQVSFINH